MKNGLSGKTAFATNLHLKNSCDVPLSYVIIKDTTSPDEDENRDVQIIHQARLVENVFTRDSRKALDILKELTIGTDEETCIRGLKCGRNSMKELQAHYYGTSEGVQRKEVARAYLKRIFYNN